MFENPIVFALTISIIGTTGFTLLQKKDQNKKKDYQKEMIIFAGLFLVCFLIRSCMNGNKLSKIDDSITGGPPPF